MSSKESLTEPFRLNERAHEEAILESLEVMNTVKFSDGHYGRYYQI